MTDSETSEIEAAVCFTRPDALFDFARGVYRATYQRDLLDEPSAPAHWRVTRPDGSVSAHFQNEMVFLGRWETPDWRASISRVANAFLPPEHRVDLDAGESMTWKEYAELLVRLQDEGAVEDCRPHDAPVPPRKLAVVTITCRRCGRVCSQSIPRWADDDEIEEPGRHCSPAFAQWDACPDHPAGAPDRGFTYSEDALPLVWSVRLIEVPS